MSSSIAALGERALIQRIRDRVGSPDWPIVVGIGDDAAVLAPERGTYGAITTDTLVEGVHFRRDWTPADAVGHKALAVNLSDLGAMGATPRASLLSLCLPDGLPVDDFDALIDGFVRLAETAGAPLVGGNLSRSPGPLIVDVTAIGLARRRHLLRRGGAKAGDELYVTGLLGAAAAGLAILSAGGPRPDDPDLTACLARYERPDARYRCGRIVARMSGASAAIDLSDGLADGATLLAEAAGIGVVVEAGAVPIHPGARAWIARAGGDPLASALSGGEDYELAFAVGRRQLSRFKAAIRRCPDVAVTRAGRFVPEPGAWLDRNGSLEPLGKGFLHF